MIKANDRPRKDLQLLASLLQRFPVLGAININKPYKPRKIKQDPAHRLKRQAYKIEHLNPAVKREERKGRKIYNRKNKMALKRRREFVRKARDQRGLD